MSRRGGGPTLAQVAAEAGVSKGTASKVLSGGGGDISEGTAARVRAAAGRLGYRTPRERARERRVGIAMAAPAPPGTGAFAGLLPQVMLAARAHALRVELVPVLDGLGRLGADVAELRLAGLLVVDPMPAGIEAWLLAHRLPAVLINQYSDAALPQVRPDDAQLVELVLDHLAAAGRRRIAWCLRARRTPHPSERVRLGAYRAWCARHARPELAVVAAPADFARQLDGIDAVAVYNVDDAIAVLRALRAAGRRVGDDVAVAAIDSVREATLVDPPLTSAGIALADLVRMAIELLARVIAGERVADVRLVPGTLVVRSSSGGA